MTCIVAGLLVVVLGLGLLSGCSGMHSAANPQPDDISQWDFSGGGGGGGGGGGY